MPLHDLSEQTVHAKPSDPGAHAIRLLDFSLELHIVLGAEPVNRLGLPSTMWRLLD